MAMILIIEDDDNIVQTLEYNLLREGYDVQASHDGEQGLEMARQMKPDLILLDVMLPKMDGFGVCRILRRESNVPIMILTARDEEIDRVLGLELGADDYVTKPFSMRELMARVKGMLRRAGLPSEKAAARPLAGVIQAGDLEVDPSSRVARRNGVPLGLKPREFELLALLMANLNRVLSRRQILEVIWGHDYIGDIRTVDVHIRWLREKIEDDPSQPKRIITIWSVGYRFQV